MDEKIQTIVLRNKIFYYLKFCFDKKVEYIL
jgi:hypothetical protein